MRLPFKIERAWFGPYGNNYWGFRVSTNWTGGVREYSRVINIEVSFGTKWGHDGYQRARTANIFGFNIYYGKPIPAEEDGIKIGDLVRCINDEESLQVTEGKSYTVQGIVFKTIDGKFYKYLNFKEHDGKFNYSTHQFEKVIQSLGEAAI